MKTVGMFDAKTHFSELVADAINGETTIVTKNGKPVAEIAPVRENKRARVLAAIQGIRRLGKEFVERNGRGLSAAEIRELIDEGRRF